MEKNLFYEEDIEFIQKSGISLDDIIHALTAEQEEVHDQVYDQICQLIGRTFERRRVYHAFLSEPERSFPNRPIIVLRTHVVEESPIEPEYLAFLAMNFEQEPSRRDFFHATLSHGYAHQLWDELFSSSIDGICRSSEEANYIQIYRAVGEAFAYWLGEHLNGFKFISENLANMYTDVLDVRTLKFIYTNLTREGNQTSPKSVIQRLPTLIQKYISGIEDVELPINPLATYLEQPKRH
jgi:hypothetical protein